MKIKSLFYVWLLSVVLVLVSRNSIANTNILEGMFDDTTQSSENSTYATSGTSYFKDDFESGLGNWVVSGKDWGLTTSESRSGGYSATDSPSGNYSSNTEASIILANSIDLSTSTSPMLTFWHKFTSAYYMYVYVSKDGGFNWQRLEIWNGTSATWYLVQIDLSQYKTSDVIIKFNLNSGSSEGDGWYIDDVIIKEKNAPIPTPTPSPTPSPSSSPVPTPTPSPT